MPRGQPGEALIKGPIVTQGYHNNPEADKNSFTADGWYCTGDILTEKNGEFYVVDRKKACPPPPSPACLIHIPANQPKCLTS